MSRLPRAPILAAGFVALAVFACLGVTVGSVHISGHELLAIFASRFGIHADASFAAWKATIVFDIRLPRVITGAFVGAGLAVSGAALQALFRNPLADPGIIGVASGAALGAVSVMHFGVLAAIAWAVPGGAIAGAIVTTFVVYGVASVRGRLPVATLLLAGIAVGSLANALTTLLLSLSLEEYEQGRQALRWLMGGLEARTWNDVLLVAPTMLAGTAFVLAETRDLDALLLGEVEAVALGVDVPRVRRRVIFATSIVVGGAVAVSGVIAFVGLVIPHVLRLLLGPAHALLLPACIVFGAAFVVGADFLCRTAFAPEELRLGVMTASLGAPFFLFLLLSRKNGTGLE